MEGGGRLSRLVLPDLLPIGDSMARVWAMPGGAGGGCDGLGLVTLDDIRAEPFLLGD